MGDFPFNGLVAVEAVMNDRLTARRIQHSRPDADQSACGDREFEVRGTDRVGGHFNHFTATIAGDFHDRADFRGRNVDFQYFKRFAHPAVDHLADDGRLADGQLITFAPHRFDQHGQMQHATARNLEGFVVARFFDSQCDVGFQFAHQSCANVACRQILAAAWLTGKRRRIDGKQH